MSTSLTPIRDICTTEDTLEVRAKITRKWYSRHLKTDALMSMDIILLDENDDHIHATIPIYLVDDFEHLTESKVYNISNFKVERIYMHKVVSHEYKIRFTGDTSVQENNNNVQISNHKFEIASFEELTKRKRQFTQSSEPMTKEVQLIWKENEIFDVKAETMTVEEVKRQRSMAKRKFSNDISTKECIVDSSKKDLQLLDQFQKADSRNFHAWNYRRYILLGTTAVLDVRESRDLHVAQGNRTIVCLGGSNTIGEHRSVAAHIDQQQGRTSTEEQQLVATTNADCDSGRGNGERRRGDRYGLNREGETKQRTVMSRCE
ncbi:hypothetical protein Sjap_008536 [Stephania japonica]|uniref:Replication protein A 70 kDa DNA-binding subunit B/D first OB fold domain-containing protein n=1 Tax=Stephania japonica TaxID=461633 RepID=A0AAP0JS37_9MAGN